MTYQNLYNVPKRSAQWEIHTFNADIGKEGRLKSKDINFHLKKLKKEQQIKSKECTRKEIIKITVSINGMESKYTRENISKP